MQDPLVRGKPNLSLTAAAGSGQSAWRSAPFHDALAESHTFCLTTQTVPRRTQQLRPAHRKGRASPQLTIGTNERIAGSDTQKIDDFRLVPLALADRDGLVALRQGSRPETALSAALGDVGKGSYVKPSAMTVLLIFSSAGWMITYSTAARQRPATDMQRLFETTSCRSLAA